MAVALVEYQAGSFALEFWGKGTKLLGHQTPLYGEQSRLNGCPESLDHYNAEHGITSPLIRQSPLMASSTWQAPLTPTVMLMLLCSGSAFGVGCSRNV